ncbi:hypothetical protein [Lysinibacillus sp. NPDC086135]|uniref:hypothetical protein n=1 Tax=Lysinibacillus sp. NPDC086135 TaxID=3364130 RepID=UPI0038287E27
MHEKQYVLLEDEKQKHVTEFNDRSVSNDEYSKLRMNSYARDKFIPKLDDNALIDTVGYYVSQCEQYRYPATTYSEAIIHVIVPELLQRFELMINEK